MTNAWTPFNRTPRGTPEGAGHEHPDGVPRMEVRSWMKRTAVRKRPKRETRGRGPHVEEKRQERERKKNRNRTPKTLYQTGQKATVQT
jgi:hypothetical protein